MKLPSFTSFHVTKLSGICLVLLLTSQNAQAFNLNFNDINTDKTVPALSYESLINTLPSLFIFQERNAAYMMGVIQNKYLTFYSDKNENLKATYASGGYYLKYTSNW